jgi:hypothetical protein
MYSNKTEQNIAKKTRSLSCVQAIGHNYDSSSKVITRSKKHAHASYHDDELVMIGDLRELKPFNFIAGRAHQSFPNIPHSAVEYLDVDKLHTWVNKRTTIDANELGM